MHGIYGWRFSCRAPATLEFINLFLGKYFSRLLGVVWILKTIKLSRRIRC